MIKYIHQLKGWPQFTWEAQQVLPALTRVRHNQGRLLGKLENLGFPLREEATLETLSQDAIKSSEIEGEKLSSGEVRSSVARKLGIKVFGEVKSSRKVDGIVGMLVDATQNSEKPLTAKRIFGWHASLFPGSNESLHKIKVGAWRDDAGGPMQVVSGAMGKERIHFEAPKASVLKEEMETFFEWFNETSSSDPVLKAAIAHLWFVTIHPFDDGNGRIARAIADMQLTRSDGTRERFYSMSAQIQKERNVYYKILESTQKGSLDITSWLLWFLSCLDRAIAQSDEMLSLILKKARFWDTMSKEQFNTRQVKMLNKLWDKFEGKLTSTKWAKISKCSQDTALRDIQDLMKRKILVKDDAGGRSTGYLLNKNF